MNTSNPDKQIAGIHHVTAIASDPQRNLDFYTEVLGLRLVKRTVNFDDPGSYHLYFGDEEGSPGTILTFFLWPHATPGSTGVGEVTVTAFSVPKDSLDSWERRLLAAGLPVERGEVRFGEELLATIDPDGMRLELVGLSDSRQGNSSQNHPGVGAKPWATVRLEQAIRGFSGVTLSVQSYERTSAVLQTMGFHKVAEQGSRHRFVAADNTIGNHVDILCLPDGRHGRLGAGSVHHVAFRVADDASQQQWRERLIKQELDVTPVMDRTYFHSVYFREPGGVLFELATDPPGFTFDEAGATLGESLKLPAWLEPRRGQIEHVLPPLRLRGRVEAGK